MNVLSTIIKILLTIVTLSTIFLFISLAYGIFGALSYYKVPSFISMPISAIIICLISCKLSSSVLDCFISDNKNKEEERKE